MKNSNDYFSTWAGKMLLEKHALDDYGLWEVYGEDPNPDMWGSHYEPLLGHFEGFLEDIIERAVILPGFWQWGSGGRIQKISHPVKVSKVSNEQRRKLEDEIFKAEEHLNALKEKLKRL